MSEILFAQNNISTPFLKKIAEPMEETDSISVDTLPEVEAEQSVHFFTDKGQKEFSEVEFEPRNTDWVYGSFAGILLLIVLLRIFYLQRIKDLFSTVISLKKLELFEKEGFIFKDAFSYIYLLIFSIGFALLLYFSLFEFGYLKDTEESRQTIYFVVLLGGTLIYMFLKTGLILMSGVLFKTIETSVSYAANMLTSAFLNVTVFIPVLVVYYFTEQSFFLYAAISIYSILLTMRIIKSVAIGRSNVIFSLFHLILYICTLEILPVLLVFEIAWRTVSL